MLGQFQTCTYAGTQNSTQKLCQQRAIFSSLALYRYFLGCIRPPKNRGDITLMLHFVVAVKAPWPNSEDEQQ